MEKNLTKKFVRFLKEHDAFGAFRRAFTSKIGIDTRIDWAKTEIKYKSKLFKVEPDETFKSYSNSITSSEDILGYAFRWADTPEGDSFWCALDREWRVGKL